MNWKLVLTVTVLFVTVLWALCLFFVLKDACQILLTFGAFMAIGGSVRAFCDWNHHRAVQRSEFLDSLIDKFEKDDVQRKVSFSDDQTKADELLNKMFSDVQNEPKVQSSLRLFSYICYLTDNGIIADTEFGMFESTLRRVLANEKVQEYLRITMNRLDDDASVYPFKNLLDYAVRHHIDIYATNSNSDGNGGIVQGTTESLTESNIVETNKGKPPLTAQELSQYPVAVIRINRLYRPDMKSNELYDTTRGWWRVNLDVANKAKYALSVAENHIKEVYAINAWHKYGSNAQAADAGADGRYQFDGEPVKDDSIRRLYVGRSIERIFKQGDAYPIRYFGVNA